MSEPSASASDQPVDQATVDRAEHEAAAEAAEEIAAADADETSERSHTGAHAGAGVPGHDDEHGHGDRGHEDQPLGPLDWGAWGAGLVGVAAGLLVAVAFALSTGLIAV